MYSERLAPLTWLINQTMCGGKFSGTILTRSVSEGQACHLSLTLRVESFYHATQGPRRVTRRRIGRASVALEVSSEVARRR